MTWINTISEGDAEGPLARLYKASTEPDSGLVDNILKIHALDPSVLRAHLGLYRASMTGGERLTPPHCEMIAWTVSRANDCFY